MSSVTKVVRLLKSKGLVITTVESCTGGALANSLTNVPGASEVLKDAFVTYSNEAKVALGVPQDILDTHTVYSQACAREMAWAGLRNSVGAQVAVGITGSLDRKDPANPDTSVPGTVYVTLVWRMPDEFRETSYTLHLDAVEPRWQNKQIIVRVVLGWIWDMLQEA